MSERERYRLYWITSILCALLSPLLLWRFWQADVPFTFRPNEFFPTFTLSMLLSIPATMLFELLVNLLRGRGVKIWIARPSTESTYTAREGLDDCCKAVLARLEELGFAPVLDEPSPGTRRISCLRPKAARVQAFTDHAFFGEVVLRPSAWGTEINARMTFDDIVVIETEETAHLQALCEYLCLQTAALNLTSVPLTLYCGMLMAFATQALSAVAAYHIHTPIDPYYLSIAAMALTGAAMVLTLMDRRRLYGFTLGLVGLFVASVPLLSALMRLAAAYAR
ncbi:MAG: hypothetical protein AB1714_02805 [Acidobacteriota bacterium]